MKIIQSFNMGLKLTVSSARITLIIYLFTLLLALLAALPFRNSFSDAMGNSMSAYTLLSNFDYTVYKDFTLQHGDIIKYFQKQFLWFGLFYLLSSIFITGGILSVIHKWKNKFTLGNFWSGCAEYFSRFFRLGIITILLQLLIAAIIYSLVGYLIASVSGISNSEKTMFSIIAAAVALNLFVAILLFVISDYAKIIMVRNDSKKTLHSIGTAIKFTFNHLIGTYALYFLFLLLPILFIILYFVIDSFIGMVSPARIIVMLIIQQIFIWLRTFFKVWLLASEYSYHSNYFVPDIEEQEPILLANYEEWNLDDLNEPKIV